MCVYRLLSIGINSWVVEDFLQQKGKPFLNICAVSRFFIKYDLVEANGKVRSRVNYTTNFANFGTHYPLNDLVAPTKWEHVIGPK